MRVMLIMLALFTAATPGSGAATSPGPADFRQELQRAYQETRTAHVSIGLDAPARPALAPAPLMRHQLRGWRQRARAAKARVASAIPHRDEWLCIAEHESHRNWSISTGNGYYGGLQMDRSFQRAYAPHLYRTKGTADRWTAEEQMLAAERAHRSRGFTPWPNTARMCGLL